MVRTVPKGDGEGRRRQSERRGARGGASDTKLPHLFAILSALIGNRGGSLAFPTLQENKKKCEVISCSENEGVMTGGGMRGAPLYK